VVFRFSTYSEEEQRIGGTWKAERRERYEGEVAVVEEITCMTQIHLPPDMVKKRKKTRCPNVVKSCY
jgi:hypothetical protein